jgi:hypothetical protein
MPTGQGDYWAVPEGTIGNLVNLFTAGGSYAQWHVVQDSKQPNKAAIGPYATYADANAVAQGFNKNPKSPAQNAADAIGLGGTTGLANKLQSPNLWTRVAEFAVGGMLLYIGIRALAGQAPGQTVSATAKKSKSVWASAPKPKPSPARRVVKTAVKVAP